MDSLHLPSQKVKREIKPKNLMESLGPGWEGVYNHFAHFLLSRANPEHPSAKI